MAIAPRPVITKDGTFGNEQDFLLNISVLDPSSVEGLRYVTRLLELSHVLSGEAQKCVERLCQEVELMTQNRAKIFIRRGYEKSCECFDATSLSFPLQFKHHVYGTLNVSTSTSTKRGYAAEPTISLPIARLLTQMCSWMLYTIEQSTFVQKQYQQLDYQIHGSLTRREKEVLTLMFHGYDQQAIADTLSISPATVRKHRQHIYSQLGVHCERDAVLAGYFSGMFSWLQEPL